MSRRPVVFLLESPLVRPEAGGSLTTGTTKEAMSATKDKTAPVVCDHRGQHPSEPLNSHEERILVMPHEPSGSRPPVQSATAKCCPACDQAKPLAALATTGHGRPASSRRDCQRAAARLASRRRAAAMRLLIAAHPRNGLACSAWSAAGASPTPPARREVAGVPEPSAHRLGRLAGWDAPSARAAALASSAACRPHPGRVVLGLLTPLAFPPATPPPPMAGPTRAHSAGSVLVKASHGGSGAATPQGALRAIDRTARPHLPAALRPAPPAAAI